MRFVHLADVHLGYQQYGSDARFDDFGRAFKWAIDYAVREQVDAILIAGDLFHKAAISPQVYLQATAILSAARQAAIPVIAIEGNHDAARYLDQISWLEVLAHEGYLILLQPTLADGTAILTPWDGVVGGYIEVGALRVVGVPWGAAEGQGWTRLVEAIQELPQAGDQTTIVLAHSGLEGEMGGLNGGLTYSQLAPLRSCAAYVALGHFHKPFEREGWIYNPGSLEHCSMDERGWSKGLYDVRVVANRIVTQHVPATPRPFYRAALHVDPYLTPAALTDALRQLVSEQQPRWARDGREPVVEISLEGTLPFDRAGLNLTALEGILHAACTLLKGTVSTERLALRGLEVSSATTLPRDQLERDVLRELVRNDSRYAPHADHWIETILALKQLALAQVQPETILATLTAHVAALPHPEADHA